MQALNFPKVKFRFKKNGELIFIFDEIRRKFVLLTPEEWVRQHVVHFLIDVKKYPKSHINVEKQILVNNSVKRYDIVVFDQAGNYFLLVECKAPQIEITQSTFDQIARYNSAIHSQFLMVTNGLNHYFCKINTLQSGYQFLIDLPIYNSIKT